MSTADQSAGQPGPSVYAMHAASRILGPETKTVRIYKQAIDGVFSWHHLDQRDIAALIDAEFSMHTISDEATQASAAELERAKTRDSLLLASHETIRVRDAELAQARKEIERLTLLKMAPVQGYARGIPWEMHMRAYDAYCKKWSPQPALIEGWCRGGFGVSELDQFIPGWREELKEITRLRGAAKGLKDALGDIARNGHDAMDGFPEDASDTIQFMRKVAEKAIADAEREGI